MKLLLLPQISSVYRESCLYYSPITTPMLFTSKGRSTLRKLPPSSSVQSPSIRQSSFPKIVHSDAVLELATNTVTFVTKFSLFATKISGEVANLQWSMMILPNWLNFRILSQNCDMIFSLIFSPRIKKCLNYWQNLPYVDQS